MKRRIILCALLSISMLFTACSKSAEITDTSGNTLSNSEKVLKMAIASETTLLSPLYMGNSNFCTATLVYENLVNYEDGKIVPGLAESWEFSEGGCKLTFHLRPNVTFHDGKPCNAKAIKANLEHKHSNPSFYTLKAVTDFESIEAVDDTTLTINYTHPYFAYLNDFCWQDVMTIVSPELLIDGDFQTVKGVIGTGPYVYDEIVSGQYTRFIRNDKYWGEKPYYDAIIVKYIPDSASRIQALKTGEIDMIYGSALMSYEEYRQASTIPGIKGQIADKDTRARDITLNASRPALSDLKVRQAIAYGINKDEISEGLTYGYEGKAEIPFTLDSPYSDIALENNYSFNQQKANALLDEAGWLMNKSTGVREKDGQPLQLLLTMDASFDSLNKSISTLLQSQLSQIGAEVSIKGMEQMEWYSCFVEGSFDITIWQPQYAYASPHCWFTPMDSTTPQTASLKGLKDSKEFLDKIKETTQTDNKEKLTELFTYLYNYDLGNVIDIPLTYSKDMIVYNSSKIGGYSFKRTPCFFDVRDLKQAD